MRWHQTKGRAINRLVVPAFSGAPLTADPRSDQKHYLNTHSRLRDYKISISNNWTAATLCSFRGIWFCSVTTCLRPWQSCALLPTSRTTYKWSRAGTGLYEELFIWKPQIQKKKNHERAKFSVKLSLSLAVCDLTSSPAGRGLWTSRVVRSPWSTGQRMAIWRWWVWSSSKDHVHTM